MAQVQRRAGCYEEDVLALEKGVFASESGSGHIGSDTEGVFALGKGVFALPAREQTLVLDDQRLVACQAEVIVE